ncbi:MAG: hypothetical protein GY866_12165, partial [Proteobacteria bacterium]|nr:hypothetical protein [Pseudomonadota bacterium]
FSGGSPFERPGTRHRSRDTEMELTLTFEEAVLGGKKTVSFNAGGGVDKIILTIPPGIEDGKKLKVREKGTVDPVSHRRGDLYFIVAVSSHKLFKRAGKDLIQDKEVKLTDLILGGSVKVTTVDNKQIELKIPPLTKNNSALRIKGKGVPANRETPGNMLVRLSARLPDSLDQKQKDLLVELAKTGL